MEVWRCFLWGVCPGSAHPAERLPGMGKQKSETAVTEHFTHRNNTHFIPTRVQAEERLKVIPGERRIFPWLTVLLAKTILSVSSYRRPMQVREYILYRSTFGGDSAYYLCPRCDITMEREYQAYCDRCGQKLGWNRIHQAKRRNLM